MGSLSTNQKLSKELVNEFGEKIACHGFVRCPSEYRECFFREVSKEIKHVVVMGRIIRDSVEYRPMLNVTHHSLNVLLCRLMSRPMPDEFMFDTVRALLQYVMPYKYFKHYEFYASTKNRNTRTSRILLDDFRRFGLPFLDGLDSLESIAKAHVNASAALSSHIPFITILSFLMLCDKCSLEREIRKAKADLKTLEWDAKEEAKELDDFIRKVRRKQKELWK